LASKLTPTRERTTGYAPSQQPESLLGLGIARNIARAHGGELTLRNGAQGGLEAVLELPR